nr:hypothetical protein [Tanacetum cinerariifolium]
MDASGGSGSNSLVWPIVDDNDVVDMNSTMDNLEERIANLEMVFAYLKKTPSSDGTTNEDIAEFEVAHKVVTQKVQTKSFPVKSPVPIKNCILRLAAAHTWACTCNKPFEQENKKMQ